jgi:hypothetical protein
LTAIIADGTLGADGGRHKQLRQKESTWQRASGCGQSPLRHSICGSRALPADAAEPVPRTGPLQSGICQREWISYQVTGRGLFGNQVRTVDIPAAVSDADARRAIDRLIERHEVLRTTFHSDGEGQPTQAVRPSSPAPPGIDGQTTGESLEAFDDRPFRLTTEWPIRFCTIPGGVTGRQLRVVVAHIAADHAAMEILAEELRELLAAPAESWQSVLPDPAPQPLDLARYEHSEPGRQAKDRALAHWRRELSTVPAGLFPIPVLRRDPWFVLAKLRSRAADLALDRIAARCGAPATSVLLAALGSALAVHCGQDVIPLQLTWSSRVSSRTHQMVASIFRDLLVRIDVSGRPTFSAAVGQAEREILRGGRRSGFDVLEYLELEATISVERGTLFRSDSFVNIRLPHVPVGEPVTQPTDAGHLDRLLEETDFSVRRQDHTVYKGAMWLSVHPDDGRLGIFVSADESVLDTVAIERLLRAVELILVRGAGTADLTFDQIEGLAGGGRQARDERWVLVDHSWVHLDVISRLMLRHPALSSADVFVDDVRGEARLTGYAATADRTLDPAGLRDFLLSVLEPRHAAMAPHDFVLCRSTDATPRDRAEWAALEIFAAGDGRHPRHIPPDGAAQQALHGAIVRANGLDQVSLAESYVAVGGRCHQVPRVVAALERAGFTGIGPDDFRRPCSLAALARSLTGI